MESAGPYTSLHLAPDNHASTSALSFLQTGCSSCRPTNSVKHWRQSESNVGKTSYDTVQEDLGQYTCCLLVVAFASFFVAWQGYALYQVPSSGQYLVDWLMKLLTDKYTVERYRAAASLL